MSESVVVPVELNYEMWKAAEPHLQEMVLTGCANATDFDSAYRAAISAAPTPEPNTNLPEISSKLVGEQSECVWVCDDPDADAWESACGNRWQFNDCGPAENGCNFCMYCGGALVVQEKSDE